MMTAVWHATRGRVCDRSLLEMPQLGAAASCKVGFSLHTPTRWKYCIVGVKIHIAVIYTARDSTRLWGLQAKVAVSECQWTATLLPWQTQSAPCSQSSSKELVHIKNVDTNVCRQIHRQKDWLPPGSGFRPLPFYHNVHPALRAFSRLLQGCEDQATSGRLNSISARETLSTSSTGTLIFLSICWNQCFYWTSL